MQGHESGGGIGDGGRRRCSGLAARWRWRGLAARRRWRRWSCDRERRAAAVGVWSLEGSVLPRPISPVLYVFLIANRVLYVDRSMEGEAGSLGLAHRVQNEKPPSGQGDRRAHHGEICRPRYHPQIMRSWWEHGLLVTGSITSLSFKIFSVPAAL
jgi:hypothetical protein